MRPITLGKRRQSMRATGPVALRAGLAELPACGHVPAYAGALVINRTAGVLADIRSQRDTAHRAIARAFHYQAMRIERFRKRGRYADAVGPLGFKPVKRHTKMRATRATAQTRMHDKYPRCTGSDPIGRIMSESRPPVDRLASLPGKRQNAFG